jgi:hypothetical protein
MSTPVFSYVFRLGFMCCTEKVNQLLNHPVMSLFDTRMSGTSTEMVSHRIQLKFPKIGYKTLFIIKNWTVRAQKKRTPQKSFSVTFFTPWPSPFFILLQINEGQKVKTTFF